VGFPHDTIDIPGIHENLHHELVSLWHSNDLSEQLLAGVQGHDVSKGHVCATAWVMSPERRHILLVQHELLGWSAPGGHMYPSETTKEAALRELEEETGISALHVTPVITSPAVIHVSDVPGERPHRHWNVSWFFTAPRNVSLTIDHGAQWWPTDNLPPGPTDLATTVSLFLSLQTL
jgi:ADP-ribose pyrophosphatase YjhB (NUDIX family)